MIRKKRTKLNRYYIEVYIMGFNTNRACKLKSAMPMLGVTLVKP